MSMSILSIEVTLEMYTEIKSRKNIIEYLPNCKIPIIQLQYFVLGQDSLRKSNGRHKSSDCCTFFEGQQQQLRMNWVSDDNNKRIQDIRERFVASLKQVSKESHTNYYDFLLVAKQLGFRFEEAGHLMSLKNHFMKNRNQLDKRRLSDLLMVHQSYVRSDNHDKLIVKFNLPDTQFDPIQEVTNEDEEYYNQSEELGNADSQSWQGMPRRESSEANISKIEHSEPEADYHEKIDIIVSIKMQEMTKKLHIINSCERIFQTFDTAKRNRVNLVEFKKGILKIFSESKQKQKISEDDIKTIFYLLDTEKQGELTEQKFGYIAKIDKFQEELREFYRSRVNPTLIKNTEFKRGKYKNQIQIFQVKNPSILELEQIQKAVLSEQLPINEERQQLKKSLLQSRKPHFGPLKHNTYNKKRDQPHSAQTPDLHRESGDSATSSVWLQRQRIERILKASKEKRKDSNSNQTIASKLRSLFIHKVILPREKMLDEEKEAENNRFRKTRGVGNYLAIRPIQKR